MSISMWRRVAAGFLLVVAVAVVHAPTASARQRPQLGPHIGFLFDGEDVLLGGQFAIPLVERLEFYPSVDVYLPNAGTQLGFNADVRYLIRTEYDFSVYPGAGINLLYRDVVGSSDMDVGVNVIGGIQTQMGTVRPFAEGRVLLHDASLFQIAVGLNFVIATGAP